MRATALTKINNAQKRAATNIKTVQSRFDKKVANHKKQGLDDAWIKGMNNWAEKRLKSVRAGLADYRK